MNFFDELKRRNVVRVGVAYGVAAWVLLQVADLVLENINAPDWVIQALMLVVGLGFIAALVIAWAYELTPEGIKKEADVNRSESIVGDTGKKLDKIIIGFLAVAVAVLLLERTFQPEPSPVVQELPAPIPHIAETQSVDVTLEPTQTSIAVLPFANMSSDADNEFFSDGISEELLNLLVRIDGLRVPSRTSSFAFKGMNTDIKDIARQLDVGHILEGSVRKSGNQVRVTAQLIDVSTDTHLWSETYDRDLQDIFVIQDEIAASIVAALRDVLGAETDLVSRASDKPTEDLEAYQEFLRGRQLFMQRGLDSLYRSVDLLRSAVARDPAFSEAWAVLAMCASTLHGWDPLNSINANAIAVEAGLKALQQDPDSANAMAGLALAYYDQKRWPEALDLLQKAEPLAIDSTPVYWYGLLLHGAGYLEQAREKFHAAELMDPVYPQLQYWIALSDLAMGNPEGVRYRFQRVVDGNNPNGVYGMTMYELSHGDPARAAQWLSQTADMASSGEINIEAFDPAQFDSVIEALSEGDVSESAIQAALGQEMVAVLGKFQAWDHIIQLERQRMARGNVIEPSNDVGVFFWQPTFKPLRQQAEFRQLLETLNIVDLWRTRGWPDLCRPLGVDDFECD